VSTQTAAYYRAYRAQNRERLNNQRRLRYQATYVPHPCKAAPPRDGAKIRYERKAALVALLGGACVRCGYDESLVALDFDHLDDTREKLHIGSDMGVARWERLVEEVTQHCQLLCANCHRIKTFERARTEEAVL
jgi:5-methylcytosine-specific restriction endonuclease McrA